MEEIKVTAKQQKTMHEINMDKRSIRETLDVALAFHSNQLSEIEEKQIEWWEEIILVYGLDRKTKFVYCDGIIKIKDNQK